MKSCSAVLLFSVVLLPSAALAKKVVTAYPATYAGGSLPLHQSKVQASLEKDEVIFMQHGRRIAVPLKNITGISCGSEVHRRFPLMHFGGVEANYIGVSWTDAQVLLKMSRAEYREFLAALEQATGKKAVNTYQVPSVVHYSL